MRYILENMNGEEYDFDSFKTIFSNLNTNQKLVNFTSTIFMDCNPDKKIKIVMIK